MSYYKVLYHNEYAKRNCVFGIVESFPEPYDEYLLSDNEEFPYSMIDNCIFKIRNGIFADKQMSVYPWRFVSEKLKSILDEFNKSEHIYFHPVKIIDDNTKIAKLYYILHFKKTIDFEESDSTLLEATKEINKFPFQAFSDSITGTFFVSDQVKRVIEEENITGIDFDKLKTFKNKNEC